MRNVIRLLLLGCFTTLALAITGCDDPIAAPPTTVGASDDNGSERRIVTLAPALTQMVVDLGLRHQIVGVADIDPAAPRGAATVGNFKQPDIEKILSLKPTHVLTMTDLEGEHPELRSLSSQHGFRLASFPSPTEVLDIYNVLALESLLSESRMSVASVLGMQREGERLMTELQAKFTAIESVTQEAQPFKEVLIVIGLDPIMASGPDTVNDELLRRFNTSNAAQFASVSAPTFDREKLLDLKPDVIVLMLPGATPLGPIDRDPRLEVFRDLDIPAVVNHRIVLINHPLAALPSTSIAEVAQELAKAVHPELAQKIDEAVRRAVPEKESVEQSPAAAPAIDASPARSTSNDA